MSDSWRPHGLYSPWNSPGQNTGVGSLSLYQGIFPTQGSNPGLPHCRWILYQLSHKGGPRTLEWVACPFSSGSSRPRNQTGISCIADGFFTNWAIREALEENFFGGELFKWGNLQHEGGMATHFIILTWRLSWREEPGGLPGCSPWGSQRIRHDWVTEQQSSAYTLKAAGITHLHKLRPP